MMKISLPSTKLATLFALTASFSTHSNALPSNAERFYEPDNEWIAPGEDDVRSPCPFVNTMANHGFINRDGKDVDLFEMTERMEDIFDLSIDFTNVVAQNAVDCGQTFTDSDGVIRMNIDSLFDPNCEEHEASLVRTDNFYGLEASKLVDDTLLNDLMRVNPTSCELTLEDVLDYQTERIIHSLTCNPRTVYGEFDILNSSAQAITLFMLGTDPTLGTVSKERLYSFLLLERIPDGYLPGQLRDTPFNFLDENDEASLIFGIFVENIRNLLAMDVKDLPEPSKDCPSGKSGK